jgi:hypothetical protein
MGGRPTLRSNGDSEVVGILDDWKADFPDFSVRVEPLQQLHSVGERCLNSYLDYDWRRGYDLRDDREHQHESDNSHHVGLPKRRPVSLDGTDLRDFAAH